jgi:gamma-glutamylcyclotransferase (GGCT)/AIG2-like uncharacterized protein YtfP
VPLIFSYGSLQEEAVQLSVYGRVLRAEPDEILNCVRERIAVPSRHKAAASGVTHYANVTFTAGSGGRVAGKVLELTETELTLTDDYERDAEYVRVTTILASGRHAWVYVSSGTAEPGGVGVPSTHRS